MKKRIQDIALKKLTKHINKSDRFVRFHNLSTCKEVGILWQHDSSTSNHEFDNFRSLLKKQGCKVQCLGFINSNENIENFSSAIESEFFNKKDCSSWSGKSKSLEVRNFVDSKFDILVDLTMDETLEVQQIVGYSIAEFKIGMNKEINLYDLTIDLGNNKSEHRFISEMMNYLERIKS